MPLNVARFYTSSFLALVFFVSSAGAQKTSKVQAAPQPTATPVAVAPTPSPTPIPTPTPRIPTAGEIMRERIQKAKAFIAVRNYNAAIYELENIRRETADTSVQAVVSVLLMNSYLEQGDYKRAQDFLNDFYAQQKTTKPNASANYAAVASQVIKSAKNRVERYKTLGLNPSDRTLPLEAVNDIEKMRDTLEVVITQSKEISKDKAKTEDALALLEEASTARAMLARDEYDARRWRDEVADTREQITSSRSVVMNAVNDGMPDSVGSPANVGSPTVREGATPSSSTVAAKTTTTAADPGNSIPPVTTNPVFNGQVSQAAEINSSSDNSVTGNNTAAQSPKPVFQPVPADNKPKTSDPGLVQKTVMSAPVGTSSMASTTNDKQQSTDAAKQLIIKNPDPAPAAAKSTDGDNAPLDVGALNEYATNKPAPTYPAAARTMHATGMVHIEVMIDENGNVAEVQKASGPVLLQNAAKDAIRKWRFRPFTRDGQPTKAVGFVNFNFSL